MLVTILQECDENRGRSDVFKLAHQLALKSYSRDEDRRSVPPTAAENCLLSGLISSFYDERSKKGVG